MKKFLHRLLKNNERDTMAWPSPAHEVALKHVEVRRRSLDSLEDVGGSSSQGIRPSEGIASRIDASSTRDSSPTLGQWDASVEVKGSRRGQKSGASQRSRVPVRAFLEALNANGILGPRQKLTREDRVGSAGDRFAKRIGERLQSLGLNFVSVEPSRDSTKSGEQRDRFVPSFSARYGSICTAAHFRQLLLRANGKFRPSEQYWESAGRYYDPFRLGVEPGGYASLKELEDDREAHLHCVRRLMRKINVFVLELSSVDAWRSKVDGAVYPVRPGDGGIGIMDSAKYEQVSFDYQAVYKDLSASLAMISRMNPDIRFVLAASSDATLEMNRFGDGAYVEAVLRASIGKVARERADVDCFPASELTLRHSLACAMGEPSAKHDPESSIGFLLDVFERVFCEAARNVGDSNEEFI